MNPTTPPEPVPGNYRHYKGGLYTVLGIARHSETEEELVVYICRKDGSLWVRPRAMFLETVTTPDGPRPRFEPIGPSDASRPA